MIRHYPLPRAVIMNDKTSPLREHSPHLSNILPQFWSLLSESEREELLIWSSYYIYKRGEVIYEPKSIPQNAYILVHGQVKITQDGDRTQILRLVRSKELFGYHAYFASGSSLTRASAVEDSLVCLIPIRSLELILLANPRVGLYFMSDLSKRLRESREQTMSLTQKHTRGRLAESLLLLKDKFGTEPDGHTIRAYLTRNELADLSNMTTSNAVRTLRSFNDEGVIHLDGRRITIRDEEKLQLISKLG